MITTLRRSLQSNAYRIFLWLFLLIMIVGGLSFDTTDTSKWAIKVYQQKMMDIEWYQSLVSAQKQIDYIKSLGINWPRTEPLEKEVLRGSVTSLLLQHNAKELDLRVPTILIQDKLALTLQNLPAYFFDASGNLNISMLEQQIAPRTFDSLLSEIENEIKADVIHNIIDLSSSYVSSFEIASQYNEEYTDKKYTVVTFSLDKAIEKAKNNPASDEVLERFYKKSEHGDTYKTAEKRAGHAWKFSAHDYGLQVSAQEISSYYEEHKHADYLEAPVQMQVRRIFIDTQSTDARNKIQAIYDEVSAHPETFEAVGKKMVAAKEKGQGYEVTDFFAKDTTKYDTLLVESAFEQLHADNNVSEIIKTDKGFEILQRAARKTAKYKSLSQVKDEISLKLNEQKFAKRFKQDAERLTSHADYNNNQAVVSFIEKRKGHKENLSLDTKKTGVMHTHLFQTDKGHYAVFMDGQHGVLLQCTEITKKALKPFHEVKSVVAADYYKKQAQQDLQDMASNAMKLAASKDLHELAKENHAQVTHAQVSHADSKIEKSPLLRRPEVEQKIVSLQTIGEVVDVVTPTESMVIRLDEVAQIDTKLFDEKKSTIKNVLISKAKYKGRDSFIASLYRRAKLKAKIEIREQLLKDAKETV